MKNFHFLKIGLILLSFNASLAQNNQSDSKVTSGGLQAGTITVGGVGNTFYGFQSGQGIFKTGIENTFIGAHTGFTNYAGKYNTAIGFSAGYSNNLGMGNIFLGYKAGYFETSSNKLYIENSNTSNPLIWGDFETDQLKFNGKVGIGGNSTTGFGSYPTTLGSESISNYNLFVTGGILTEELRVKSRGTNGQWADYVFAKDYDLKPLSEVETFINNNGHLPNVPSAEQVKEEGIELGEMAKIQQEKIEELTLYLIQQNKQIEELKAQVKLLLDKK